MRWPGHLAQITNVCIMFGNLAENLKGMHRLRQLGVYERIILKWGVNVWDVWIPLKARNLLTSSETFDFRIARS